jgi:pimeloyl-ACP methyl ester carboxylesterase
VGISKFHLLGLSLGGAVAYQLCLDHPDKVGRVIIVNAIPNYRLTNPTLIIQYILRSVLLNVLGMDAIAKIVSKKLFPNEDQTSLREYGYQKIRKASKKSYLKTMKALVQWSIEPQLSRINTPLLYIVSEYDSLANSYKDIVDKIKPNSTIHVISNAHHAVNIEYPEKFNKAVLDFLT